MLHFLVSVNESYPGAIHHDMIISWHNAYYQYVYRGDEKEGTYGNLSQLLELECRKKLLGPAFPLK